MVICYFISDDPIWNIFWMTSDRTSLVQPENNIIINVDTLMCILNTEEKRQKYFTKTTEYENKSFDQNY